MGGMTRQVQVQRREDPLSRYRYRRKDLLGLYRYRGERTYKGRSSPHGWLEYHFSNCSEDSVR